MSTQRLIAPGYRGSGDDHWQTYWQKDTSTLFQIFRTGPGGVYTSPDIYFQNE